MIHKKPAKVGRPTSPDRQVKQGLLDIAIRLLSRGGPTVATARAVCAEAGVGAPALYHHYGDLNGLHQAAIDEAFRQVATAYRRSARSKGALQGIHDGWDLLMHFARQEPLMCRFMIQKIISGEPPRSIAGTLRRVAKDLRSLKEGGALTCSPEFAAQLLWTGALGATCFASMERPDNMLGDPAVLEALLEAILDSILARRKIP